MGSGVGSRQAEESNRIEESENRGIGLALADPIDVCALNFLPAVCLSGPLSWLHLIFLILFYLILVLAFFSFTPAAFANVVALAFCNNRNPQLTKRKPI